MVDEQRKTSDIILELEAKLDILIAIIRTQDLNIKVISNKLNLLSDKIDKAAPQAPPNIKISAVDTKSNVTQTLLPSQTPIYQNPNLSQSDRQFLVKPEDSIPMVIEPGKDNANRRISRDVTSQVVKPPQKVETVQQIKQPVQQVNQVQKYPMQMPVLPVKQEINIPVQQEDDFKEVNEEVIKNDVMIPVTQRVIDSNSKSVFIANVEIIDINTMESVRKTRTNGAGKWAVTLPTGQYRVLINHKNPITKDKMDLMQEIMIDGTQSSINLGDIVLK